MSTLSSWKRVMIVAFGVAALGVCIWFAIGSRCRTEARPRLRPASAAESRAQMLARNAHNLVLDGKLGEAGAGYRQLVGDYSASAEKPVGEQVARARYQLAMVEARSGDYSRAEELFGEVARAYKGTGEPSRVFGTTICERAMFQRAICLHQSGRTNESLDQLADLIDKYPLGLQASQAESYIRNYNEGQLTQRAVAAIAKRNQRLASERRKLAVENATCGPVALAYVCKHYDVNTTARQIARTAKTDARGTTMLDLANAARSLGFTARGLEVDLQGLSELSLPSIILVEPSHYTVLASVNRDTIVTVDPAHGLDQTIAKDRLGPEWRGKVLELRR